MVLKNWPETNNWRVETVSLSSEKRCYFTGNRLHVCAVNLMAKGVERVRRINPQLRLFLAGMVLLGIAGGIFETAFNNFVSEKFDLSADKRGFLEFPRELPGFLTALFAGLLFFLPETYIAAAAALAIGLGMFGMAFWGPNWYAMLFFMTLWSIGTHLIMPVRSSIGMNLAQSQEKGRRLGQIQSAGIAASIIGCAIVWIPMRHFGAGYEFIFMVGGAAGVIAAVVLAAMRLPGAHLERPKFIWRKEYWLYYVLSFLFGARKQMFITFGPWVLVKVFNQPVWVFAQLWIAASVLGIFFQPTLGKLIDGRGVRFVLMWDAALVFVLCAVYAFSPSLPDKTVALWVLYGCLVMDQLLFGTGMARDIYLSKIAVKPEHVAPSLSLGVTINHIVSMSIPSLGGIVWMQYGYTAVFVAAGGIALFMLFFARMIRTGSNA
jgi:MFS family permease